MLWLSLCSFLGFSSRFCSYWKPNFPAISVSYLRGFSGRICSYWQPNFPAVSGSYLPGFPAVSAVTGSQIVLVSTTRFSVLNTGILWREAKTKKLFSQCSPIFILSENRTGGLPMPSPDLRNKQIFNIQHPGSPMLSNDSE